MRAYIKGGDTVLNVKSRKEMFTELERLAKGRDWSIHARSGQEPPCVIASATVESPADNPLPKPLGVIYFVATNQAQADHIYERFLNER